MVEISTDADDGGLAVPGTEIVIDDDHLVLVVASAAMVLRDLPLGERICETLNALFPTIGEDIKTAALRLCTETRRGWLRN